VKRGCDIADPYQILTWASLEGGPRYAGW
jgi:hypothetical protein